MRRVVEITSDPDGATVWLNDREIGTTPVEVEIVYYGEYDVQVAKAGYEPISTFGSATAPTWDLPGFDLLAELVPVSFESRNTWHFTMTPDAEAATDLFERAEALRERVVVEAVTPE